MIHVRKAIDAWLCETFENSQNRGKNGTRSYFTISTGDSPLEILHWRFSSPPLKVWHIINIRVVEDSFY